MKLFNLNRTATCGTFILLLMLAIPSVSRSQEPITQIEKDMATATDRDGKSTSRDEEENAAAVAVSFASRRVDVVVSAQPEFQTEHLAAKTRSKTPDEAPALNNQDSTDDSEWHFGVAPYLFAAGISGTVGARGRTLEVDANFGNVWENLDMGLMGAFEARKGRFVILNDLLWTKLSAEKDTPGPFYSTAKLGVNIFIFDPEVGYRFVDSEKGSLDVLGGVRIWSVETNLNVTTGAMPGFDVSQRKTWAAPVVGLHGVANITPKFFLAGKFDIGGAGIGADLTTQLYGAAGYKITKHVALIGGYRWLQVDYDDEAGFLFDTQMSGLMFGAKFSW
jgi:hypothetical protein